MPRQRAADSEGRSPGTRYRCSFCGKAQDQVRQLIAGPGGVYICNECIELCRQIIEDEQETTPSSQSSRAWRSEAPITLATSRPGATEVATQGTLEQLEAERLQGLREALESVRAENSAQRQAMELMAELLGDHTMRLITIGRFGVPNEFESAPILLRLHHHRI